MTYEEAKKIHDRIVAQYNREYRAGLWSTNRELASRGENAYSAMVEAAQREGKINELDIFCG